MLRNSLLTAVVMFSAFTVVLGQSSANEIVFCGNTGPSDYNYDIYSIRTNGTGQVRLTNNSSDFSFSLPRWSPNGAKILFARDWAIWTMDPDGGNQSLVIDGNGSLGEIYDPAWTRDGTRIVFSAGGVIDPQFGIYVINANGTNLTPILYGVEPLFPDLSPDGNRVVFQSTFYYSPYYRAIYTANSNGTGVVLLTDADSNNQWPRWSPDGSKIAFTSDRDGNDEIYLMNADGSKPLRLTNSPGRDWSPTWSPDGKRLAFSSDRNGVDNIYAMNADGSDVVQITNNAFRSFNPHWRSANARRNIPFDFDGDGKTDIGVTRPNGGIKEWWLSRSSDSNVFSTVFGVDADVSAPADFTGDGKADIAVFRPSTGFWYVLRSEDFSYTAFPFGSDGDIPMPADFDGDGKADPAVFRPSGATWFINRSSDGQTTIAQFGAPGDQPVAADYDGDGKADIAIYRQNNGAQEWWIQRSTAGLFATVFGASGDKAVAGDYTGDGKTDIAVWRPSNGNWFILRSEDFSYLAFPWGANGDLPAPGDYDGDGKTDAAVFRQSSATWFLNRTGGQGPLITNFGAATDSPVAGAFVR